MSSHKSRLEKLEAKHASNEPRRIVVVYADQTAPAELEALRNDPAITLLIIEYVDKPTREEVTA